VEAQEARRWLLDLEHKLDEMVRRDRETEIDASTLHVIEALIAAAEEHLLPGDPVVEHVDKFFSPASIGGGLPVLASQVEIIVGMVAEAMPPVPREHGRPII
jgi:hypothetical protein